jgi:hypothetical protein
MTSTQSDTGGVRDGFSTVVLATPKRSERQLLAVRIGERLEQVSKDAAEAGDAGGLLPVLRDHQARVDDAFDAVVPHTTGSSSSATDGEGWAAGHAAADLAQLDVTGRLRARSGR